MSDSHWTLLAQATDASRSALENLPSTIERGAQAVANVPMDIGELPLFAHMAAVIPAADLVFGGGMLVFIILVHAAGVRSVTGRVTRRTPLIMARPTVWRSDMMMAGVVFALLALHLLEIFLWASALVYSNLVPDWRTAGFFAGNTYTTVGYGNFVLPLGWRMLAPIIAMSGLFTFGWSGSVLVDIVRRCNAIRDAAVAAKAARASGKPWRPAKIDRADEPDT
ncbi:MAG TPA: potassium channel family protein [Casimicrobiaceae bacterium]